MKKHNILMISWYDFEIKFGWTQRCLWIFDNIHTNKFIISYSERHPDSKNTFFVSSRMRKYSKFFQILSYFSPKNIYKLYKTIKGKEINIVLAETFWCALPAILLKSVCSYTLIFDTHNFELEYAKQKWWFQIYIVYFLEWVCCQFSDKILVCSEREKTLFWETYWLSDNKISVLPNGMNMPSVKKDRETIRRELGLTSDTILLVFVGKLDYLPNKEAVEYIIENIDTIIWDIQVLIVWPGDQLFNHIHHEKITFLWYTDSVYDYINAADICLAPIFKWSGTRLKILEYIAMDKLIISTQKWHEGIPIDTTEWLSPTDDLHYIHTLNTSITQKDYLKQYDNWKFIQQYLWKNTVTHFFDNFIDNAQR